MPSIINLTSAPKTALANALKAAFDAGGAAGSIEIYAGVLGETGQSTKLVTLTLPYPCGTTNLGALTFGTIPGTIATANGVASWARFKTSAGDTVTDVNMSSSGGTAFLRLNTTSIVKDGVVTVTSCVFEF